MRCANCSCVSLTHSAGGGTRGKVSMSGWTGIERSTIRRAMSEVLQDERGWLDEMVVHHASGESAIARAQRGDDGPVTLRELLEIRIGLHRRQIRAGERL